MTRRSTVVLTAFAVLPLLLALAPGARIDVDVVEAMPTDVFRSIGQTLGADEVRFDHPVDGRLSMRLEGVTAATALDAACESLGCSWHLEGNILVVVGGGSGDQRQADLDTPMQWSLERASTRTVLESIARILGVELAVDETTAEMSTTLELDAVPTSKVLDALCEVQGCQWHLDETTGSLVVGRAGYGLQLAIDPSPDDPEIFRCRAVITDLATGEVVSAPSVVSKLGEPVQVTTGLPDGRVIALGTTFERDGEIVRFQAELTENGRVMARQATELRLD